MTKKKIKIIYYIAAAVFLILMGIVLFMNARNRLVHYYEIKSDEGFSFEDVELMNLPPSVRDAYAIVNKKSGSKDVITVRTLHGRQPDIAEGRMPDNDKEILIDRNMAVSVSLGDSIILGDEEYRVIGIVENKDNMSACAYCLPAALHDDRFNRMGVEIYGEKSVGVILDDYIEDLKRDSSARMTAENENKINQLREKFSMIDDAGSDKLKAGKEELDHAYDMLSDGEKQLLDSEKKIADSEDELASYDEMLAESQDKLTEGKEQLDKSKIEIEDARMQLEDELAKYGYSIASLPEAEKMIKETETQIIDGKNDLDSAKNELADGYEQLKDAKSQLDDAKDLIDSSREQLNDELAEYGYSIDELIDIKQTISDYIKQYHISIDDLYDLVSQYPSYEEDIIGLRDSCIELIEMLEKGRDEYDEEEIKETYSRVRRYYDEVKNMYIHADLELSIKSLKKIKEESEKVIAAFGNAENITIVLENMDRIEEAIKAYNDLESYEQEYEAKYKEYQAGLDIYDQGKREYNAARKDLEEAEKELEEQKKIYDDAVSAYNQINDAQKQYDEKYAEYLAGLKTYENEKIRYDEARAELDDAKLQVADARAELDSNRGEYDKEKDRYGEVSSDFHDELDSINRQIKEYEDKAGNQETGWKVSECIQTRDDENAFIKAGIIFILMCIALLTVGWLINKKSLTNSTKH